MKTQLILAVDLEDKEQAKALLEKLRGKLTYIKIGLQLFTKYGPAIVDEFAAMGFKIFLDLKLHDIPNTVASAIKSLRGKPIELLTIHTLGGNAMMAKAVETAKEVLPDTRLLGVTVLTSMDTAQLNGIGIGREPMEQVEVLAKLAVASGMKGLVCSPLELPALRKFLGEEIALVTPGIRPKTASLDDQSRIMTPADAAAAGASYIVVGRPILKADDPAAAALAIQAELA
ncbi:MAG: orotidine-5'-phosphate decarboxylase [Opitutales bacterium]|nr:orotidine-5'-phosphate decarboxylase [Opitutales bacterium]